MADVVMACEGCGPVPACGQTFRRDDGVYGVPGYPSDKVFCPNCAGTLKAGVELKLIKWSPETRKWVRR